MRACFGAKWRLENMFIILQIFVETRAVLKMSFS